jgi:hypothetical protein
LKQKEIWWNERTKKSFIHCLRLKALSVCIESIKREKSYTHVLIIFTRKKSLFFSSHLCDVYRSHPFPFTTDRWILIIHINSSCGLVRKLKSSGSNSAESAQRKFFFIDHNKQMRLNHFHTENSGDILSDVSACKGKLR